VAVADADTAEALLRLLGYRPSFRCQKYREEYASDGAVVTVDETPIGTFVEIEGDVAAIDRIATALGRSRADYQVDSYARLFQLWCQARGIDDWQMVFENLRSVNDTEIG